MQPLTKVVCPHCHAILKCSKPLRPGKQVSCLKCRAPFSVSPSDLMTAASVQELLVSSSLAEAADREYFVIEVPGDSLGIGAERPEEIPVGVLERTSLADKGQVSAPYFPPPVQKTTVPIAAPFLSLPARHGGALAAAFAGLLVFLGCGLALTWYCFQRNSGAEEPAVTNPNLPSPKGFAEANSLPPDQETPVPAKEKSPSLVPKTKPASVEESPKTEPEAKKPGIKVRPRPAPPLEMITFALPEGEQTRVNEAIERGIQYLKAQQLSNGSWSQVGNHSVGYAALPGLTLLECQVPAGDPVVKKAAIHIRTYSETLTDTYDLSLAVLFLDRLGERKDRGLIQKLALRLLAGQKASGGWDYQCPLLNPGQSNELMLFLHQTRPKYATLLYPLPKEGKGGLADPLGKPGSEPFANPLAKDKKSGRPDPDSKLIPPGDSSEPDPAKSKNPGAKPKVPPKAGPQAFTPPAFKQRGKRRLLPGRDDNSNTQFALLALWAARRHDVPTENCLTLSQKRFQTSQNPDGGWGYVAGFGTSDAMTGVGLLGLAIAHGASEKGILATVDARAKKTPGKAGLQDPVIHKGLQTFGKYIGAPDPDNKKPTMVNLYFLWTLERVAMIYNLQTIGNKDWYRWGAHILLPNQHQDGSWFGGHYPGAAPNLDTCFALLFLKRSNLVPDLTENLDLLLAITDPDANKRKKR